MQVQEGLGRGGPPVPARGRLKPMIVGLRSVSYTRILEFILLLLLPDNDAGALAESCSGRSLATVIRFHTATRAGSVGAHTALPAHCDVCGFNL